MTSMDRPSRRVRASATAMRYWGLRILPNRVSLILTAMIEAISPDYCHAAIQRSRAECPDPVLPYVCDHRGAGVPRQTAAHCARTATTGGNRALAAVGRSQDLVVALDLDAAGQPPACGGADELVVVPDADLHHLGFLALEHHRVEAEGAGGGRVPGELDRGQAEHVGVEL